MPKPRTKRGAVREERKRKRKQNDANDSNDANRSDSKRQRTEAEIEGEAGGEGGYEHAVGEHQNGAGETEFFGVLTDEEQEYFRGADELLELNEFPSAVERDIFIQNVFKEAKDKELKLASSQSCSRLMERLIQLANTAQKKRLFEAFGGHFLSLVQHRFASHCCEALFLQSAGIVTTELAGFVMDTTGTNAADQKPEASMEDLFLATLDELEGHLGYLMTDRFASHTLRVLLVVLSGRPLEDAATKSLLKSKKKENITVAGTSTADEAKESLRAVPGSFTMAAKKIIQDATADMDATGLRVLCTHPIGNPILQLLLELDLTLNKKEAKADDSSPSLLRRLLPGAPQSLSDEKSEATAFINGMIYDPIGSRIVETIITHAPGKVFKGLNHNIILPRIESYVRNYVSSYAAIRALNRMSKEDLEIAVENVIENVPDLVDKFRFLVLRTLFERCAARGLKDKIRYLMVMLNDACGTEQGAMIKKLCGFENEAKRAKDVQEVSKNAFAIRAHGCQLLSALLKIPGPCKVVQKSLLEVDKDVIFRLADENMATVTVLTTALKSPSVYPSFHREVVGVFLPTTQALATSKYGHNVAISIADIPSKGRERCVPFHTKEAMMGALARIEDKLRETWYGRNVWRAWKGDMWKTHRADWKAWVKREVDEQP